jgi:hypothetical protein
VDSKRKEEQSKQRALSTEKKSPSTGQEWLKKGRGLNKRVGTGFERLLVE